MDNGCSRASRGATFTETPEHKFNIAHLPSVDPTTTTHHPSTADPDHSFKMTFKFLSNRKIPRHLMIRRFKATFLGVVIRIHRVSTVRRDGRLVEHEHGKYQSPVVSDSASSLSSGPVMRVPWDRPPEIFERPAGMAPDPVLEACLQLYRDYYEGRLSYGPNGEPIFLEQVPDHPEVNISAHIPDGIMSEDTHGGRAELSPAAAYACTQARRLGLSQNIHMVQSGQRDGCHLDRTSVAATAAEGQEAVEWPTFEAANGAQDAGVYVAHSALEPEPRVVHANGFARVDVPFSSCPGLGMSAGWSERALKFPITLSLAIDAEFDQRLPSVNIARDSSANGLQ
ncbi:hypothetical protein WOLCODRAFT_162789 [Wolfiporia cocos MD-104 SS10]|uniref:Uncharacterized protein n=1 Tax=Wolfiporia cocos (strain MD-104) TaxID=742152 RepID=A0A2H3JGP5_WOLCO|nr:hypothetical protein WOLCODRAFT_162789 [Wolfiporia cocos MD-104 SS10]